MVEAKRATPASLQASTLAAWAAFGRVDGNTRVAEIQVAPDGRQLALIAAASDIDALQRLVANIDSAEPVETRHYRPRFFGIDEVAGLLQQLLKSTPGGVTGIEVVRDPLTSSLVITATSAQHQRGAGLLRTLDDAPANSRRQVRTFAVKHRQADEIAKVLTGLISSGAVTVGTPDVAGGAAANPAVPAAQSPAPATGTSVVTTGDNPVTVTTDSVTNSVICLGDPRALDQVQALLIRLDRRQPQVDLEVVLVTLSASEGRDLGVELAGRLTRGELTYTATSLFGLSTAPAADPIERSLGNAAGFGGVVINPGDYAGVIRALETVANGKSIIKSRVVVNNNAKATVNGVVQEPVTSINSGQQVATTTYAGTSDAGTQLTISPQISPADYITLTYTISQSAFLGDSTISANGSVIPPTKRTDSLASVATIPDGFVIGLGGLSNRSNNLSESRLPFLGSVPLLGYLFKSQSTSEAESRFYVFIRANVLRHEGFADLRRLSAIALDKVPEGGSDGPRPEPQLMK